MDLKAIFVNQAGQDIFGIEGDEQVKRTAVLDYFATSERSAARKKLLPALLEHGQVEFETVGRNFKTDADMEIFCTCFVIPNAKTREPAFLAAVARDITERKKAEKQLEIYHSVVRHSPDFIGVANMDLELVFVNPAGKEIFGLESDEEVSSSHTLDYFAESERARVRDELIPQLIRQGHLNADVPGRNFKSGRPFPARWTSFVIRDSKTGEPSLLAAVTQDITVHKRIEDELRRRTAYLTEAQSISHTGSWSWNLTTNVGTWSDELFRILGLTPGAVVPSPAAYAQRVHPADRQAMETQWTNALLENNDFDDKHRIIRPDGSVRHVRRLGRPVSERGRGNRVHWYGDGHNGADRASRAEPSFARAS